MVARKRTAKKPPIKPREELAQASFKMYMGLKQFKEKLESGELSEEDVWGISYDRADRLIQQQLADGRVDVKGNLDLLDKVTIFREEQEKKYRNLFEWNTANDEATLNHILDTEANIYEIRLSLDGAVGKNPVERQKLMTQHAALSDKHKDFLAAAGIDRLSREKKKLTNEPFDDWIRIKRLGDEKMEGLKEGLLEAIRECENEFDLRNAIKYHLGYDFSVVDTVLLHHRRVLGLPMQLEAEKSA